MRGDINELNIDLSYPFPSSAGAAPSLEPAGVGKTRSPTDVFMDEFRPLALVFSTAC
jgi:hypothetical protein